MAAEIIAGRPPTTEMTTAMVNEVNSPIAGSTPTITEKEIASGISASPTTRPASSSVRNTFGDSQEGRNPRSLAAGDSTEEDKSGKPVVQGVCGQAQEAGAASATPTGNGPLYPHARRPSGVKPLGSRPGRSGVFAQHSMMFTARPPRAVSLYFTLMSAPVSFMVLMTLSRETL